MYPPMPRRFGASGNLSTAGIILGIVSTLFSLVPCLYLFAAVCAILAIVFTTARIIYQRDMREAPDVTAIIGLVFAGLGILITFFGMISLIRAYP